MTANAAQITSRKFTLSSSAGAATGVAYTFDSAALPTTTAPRSVAAQACTTASGACTTPTGFTSASSTLVAQPTGLGATTAWTVDVAVTGSLRITHATNVTAASGAVNIQWGSVTNPTAQNTTFYLRVTIYSDAAWTTALDTGTVAVSTAQQISLSGTMDETLVFCVGTSITGQDCGTVAGTSVAFGTFSTTAAKTGTSVMAASTNGSYGYSITVNGTTLTCTTCNGTKTISALATQTASSTGTEQFGLNLKANTLPAVFGTEVTGTGTATATANYATANSYRFVTADSVASVAGSTNANTFTAAYIVNVAGTTEAGTYNATMTYIATATF